MNQMAKFLNMTEQDLNQAVEHYHTTGQILNRAVAIEVGLCDEYYMY